MLRGGKVIEHRALGNQGQPGGDGANTHERRVRVTLAAPHAGWRDTLAAIAGSRVIEASDADALLSIADGAAEQARVLREIISAGAAVTSYAEETENLHQSYLRTVQPDARPT